MSIDSIQNNTLIFSGCRYITELDHRRYARKCLPQRGDLLLGKAASVGKIAHVTTDKVFNVWSPLAVIRVDDSQHDSRFFYYCFQSSVMQYQCQIKSNSNTQANLGMGDISNLAFVSPPVQTQRTIAAFLDHETARIDQLIAKQQRLIELLKEKRQAVISHAVTKGLNPDAPMKDSGVEWLGEVPEHWVVLPIGRITTSKCDGPFGSGLKSSHYKDNGARVIRLQNIKGGQFNDTSKAFIALKYFQKELKKHEVIAGDVLIAGLGDENNSVGRACVAPEGISPAMVKADCFRFRLNTEIADPQFIASQITAGSGYDAGILATGSTRSRIPLSVTATRKIALPPSKEQVELMTLLNEKLSQIDQVINYANKSMALLKERRTALISAAVTGKIDVRNWTPDAQAPEQDQLMAAEPSAEYRV